MTRTALRPRPRRAPRLELLESRELLTGGGPSDQQLYMLSLLNLARTNPALMADRVTQNLDPNVQATLNYYNVDLNRVKQDIASTPAQPPLAWNDQLASAAQGHSQDMSDNGFQSHTGSDGSDSGTRLDRAGYTNRSSSGENAYAYATSVDEAMQAFLIDWGVASNGHRTNILQPGATGGSVYREVGIGLVQSNRSDFGPLVVTQDFGAQNGAKADLLGIAFNDSNNNNFFDPGEGQGNVTINALNLTTGRTTSVQTWDSGGYQMALDPGEYQVSAVVGNQVVQSQAVNIGSQNVEVDYNLSQLGQSATPVTSSTTPAPATPQPAAAAPSQPQATTAAASTTPSFDPSWITSWVTWKD
jgi:uncharacterized protein YkwD